MYLERYRLRLKPFLTTADPTFLWLGDKHREALAVLRSGLMAERGITMLTGEEGTGKTVLIKRLISETDQGAALVTLTSSDLDGADFYNLLSDGLKTRRPLTGREDFLQHMRESSKSGVAAGKPILIIDQAHWLNAELLEEIRWLTGSGLKDRKWVFFLAGLPQLNQMPGPSGNRLPVQSVLIRHRLDPLEEREIAAYLEHRLETAGCDREIFDPEAVFEIYEHTGGVPRLINIVCERALMIGDARGLERIEAPVIRESAAQAGIAADTPRPDPIVPEVPQSGEVLQVQGAVQNTVGGEHTGWVFSPHEPFEAEPDPPPETRSLWRSLMAIAILLLVAFLVYHFTPVSFYVEAISAWNEARQDDRAGDQAVPESGRSDGVSTVLMPSVAGGKANGSSLLLKENVLITFDINSNELNRESTRLLDAVVDELLKRPGQSVVIRGYTDNSGPVALNEQISRQRAETVKSYLAGKGAQPERIEVLGMGPLNPIASNDTPEGRRQNRRVEIEFPQN